MLPVPPYWQRETMNNNDFFLTKEVTQWYPSIWPDFVLIRVTIDMTKHLDQKQLGRKSLFFYTLISLLIRSKGRIGIERAGTWWQELIQRLWRALIPDLLLIACTACSIKSRTTSPSMEPPTMGWVLPHWSLRKCSTAGSHGGVFSPEVPSLACVELI